MTLATQIDAFIVHLGGERGFSENTVRSYRSDLLGLAEFAGERPLDLELLRDWLWASSEQGLAKTTIARQIGRAHV